MIQILILAALFALVLDYGYMIWQRRRLPPGPFPWPIVGNHFQTPSIKPWIAWEKWAQYYDSPMLTLWIGRSPRIILSDTWVASDLLEKRSDIFSSRPRFVVMGDAINTTENSLTNLVYGDRWRLHRRLMLALAFMEAVDYVIPGVFIMESIPALLHAPVWLYELPSKLRSGSVTMSHYFYLLTQEGAKAKQDNFAKYVLEAQRKHHLSDFETANLTSLIIGGGVDTTSSTMLSCILAMAYFPHIQAKAHAEMDAVIGHDRSPTWADIDSQKIPYLVALVKETLRWRTVTVLAGIPHANIKPVDYNGYHFPANTNFTANLWAIHRHPRDFPDPDNFLPERFLDGEDSAKMPYPNKYGMNPFGWGRRRCSGQPLAEQGLWYSMARMIWAFDILPGLDENGNQVKLDIFAYTKSENMRPEPFKVRFVPRSDRIKEVMLSEAAEAREALRCYDGETKVTVEKALESPITV
ncbi:cytochrome P450 [Bipolaris maydis]|nr:cytochrome P450 [Bipolaris maydis]